MTTQDQNDQTNQDTETDDDGELRSAMTSITPFSRTNKASSLRPKDVSQDDEQAVQDRARERGFLENGTDAAASETATAPKPVTSSLIPVARANRVDDNLATLSRAQWYERYADRLQQGQQLDRPVSPYSDLPKDRFTQMMPGYLWAALEAVAMVNGFKKEHELIEFMLEKLGVFEDTSGTDGN